jgi:hypothetical protein
MTDVYTVNFTYSGHGYSELPVIRNNWVCFGPNFVFLNLI